MFAALVILESEELILLTLFKSGLEMLIFAVFSSLIQITSWFPGFQPKNAQKRTKNNQEVPEGLLQPHVDVKY